MSHGINCFTSVNRGIHAGDGGKKLIIVDNCHFLNLEGIPSFMVYLVGGKAPSYTHTQ